jgi:predicted amidohydrolase
VTRFAIAGIQMRVSATEDNVATMRHRLATLMAIYPWIRTVVFSEPAVSGPLPQAAQPIPGPAEVALQAMAAKHDLWLVSGSMYESSGDHVYNTASVIDPDGEVVASTTRATNTPSARSIPQRTIPVTSQLSTTGPDKPPCASRSRISRRKRR